VARGKVRYGQARLCRGQGDLQTRYVSEEETRLCRSSMSAYSYIVILGMSVTNSYTARRVCGDQNSTMGLTGRALFCLSMSDAWFGVLQPRRCMIVCFCPRSLGDEVVRWMVSSTHKTSLRLSMEWRRLLDVAFTLVTGTEVRTIAC
jgi:hypothetical protein